MVQREPANFQSIIHQLRRSQWLSLFKPLQARDRTKASQLRNYSKIQTTTSLSRRKMARHMITRCNLSDSLQTRRSHCFLLKQRKRSSSLQRSRTNRPAHLCWVTPSNLRWEPSRSSNRALQSHFHSRQPTTLQEIKTLQLRRSQLMSWHKSARSFTRSQNILMLIPAGQTYWQTSLIGLHSTSNLVYLSSSLKSQRERTHWVEDL